MALSFGVTVMPDPPYGRLIELFQRAEEQGFEYGWTYDSHILWQESYALLAIAGTQTSKMKLGHCVTNPGIRDPTITASWYATMQDVSNGRMVMGIGRGDSARRVRELLRSLGHESELYALTIDDADTSEVYGSFRVGVIGKNGTGKSHFVRLLAGHPVPDEAGRRALEGG